MAGFTFGSESGPFPKIPLGQAFRPTQQPSAPGAPRPAGTATPPQNQNPNPVGLPYDPAFQQSLLNNQTSYSNTLAGINANQGDLQRNYGFNGQNGTLDPSNPFSKAMLLKQAYTNNTRRATNSYAARGQLYGGSLQNAQNQNVRTYDQNYDATRQAYLKAYATLQQDRGKAQSSLANADTTALQNSLALALQNQAQATAAPAAAGRTPRAPRKLSLSLGTGLGKRQKNVKG